MREQLKNELLLMLDKYCDNTTLPLISQKLDVILSNYDLKIHIKRALCKV